MTKVDSMPNGELVFSDLSKTEVDRNFLKIIGKIVPEQLAKLSIPTQLEIITSNGQKITGTWGSQRRLYVNKTRFPFEEGMILKISFLNNDSIMISDISK